MGGSQEANRLNKYHSNSLKTKGLEAACLFPSVPCSRFAGFSSLDEIFSSASFIILMLVWM